jgi:hypothetical protein
LSGRRYAIEKAYIRPAPCWRRAEIESGLAVFMHVEQK